MKSFFTRPPPRARFSTPIETNERLRNGGGGVVNKRNVGRGGGKVKIAGL